MGDNEITAIVGWPTEPEMAKFRKVVAAASAAERERWMKASTAALEILDDLPAWSNAGHACQLLREALGPNDQAHRPDPAR